MQLFSSSIRLIGFGRDVAAEGYEVFKEAMAEIGVLLCRHIHHPTNRNLAFPEVSHWKLVVLIARGPENVQFGCHFEVLSLPI